MPLVAQPLSAPSTLGDVLGQVVDVFGEAGDGTQILVGKKYLAELGAGGPPRIVFAPEPGGKMGPPLQLGNVACVTHSCEVFVRAAEGLGDLDRFDAAYALLDKVVNAIRRAATGRLEFGDFSEDSPSDDDAYGADVTFSFTYERDIKRDPAIWGVAPAPDDTSDPQPILPPGLPATDVAIDVTTVPQEPS